MAAMSAIALLLPTVVFTVGPGVNQAADRELRSPGKPGARVSLSATERAPSGGKAAVAQRLAIELSLAVPADAEWLSVAVSATDALSLVSGGEVRVSTPKTPLRHVVSVVPQAQGKHYLGVTVLLQRNGERRMRAFAVPVTVGSANAAIARAKRTDVARNRDGELVVITHSR